MDGYIADKNGEIGWLNSMPNPENITMGYNEFTSKIDAIIMGRTTFEIVCNFDMEWPYQKPVFVLSTTLNSLADKYKNKAVLIKGSLTEILEQIHAKGYYNLYIDGGKTIQNFLKADLIDEITITTIPYLLGEGIPLFSNLPKRLDFKCLSSKIYLNKIVQNHFVRNR